MSVSRALVVAPSDSPLAAALSESLLALGASPVRVSTAAQALTITERSQPDIVAIEVGGRFPEGIELIQRLRNLSSVPIVALAESDEGAAVARALEVGADDYLTAVPASVAALDARLTSLQRAAGVPAAEAPPARVRELTVDYGRYEASIGGRPLKLTATEFRFLEVLMRNAGGVVSAQRLLREVKGYVASEAEARASLKPHLSRLRAKMKPFEAGAPYIVNVRGFGYMLEPRAPQKREQQPWGDTPFELRQIPVWPLRRAGVPWTAVRGRRAWRKLDRAG